MIEQMKLTGRLAFIPQDSRDGLNTILIGGVLKSSTNYTTEANGGWEMVECTVTIDVYRRYHQKPDTAVGCKIDMMLTKYLPFLDQWEPIAIVDYLPERK